MNTFTVVMFVMLAAGAIADRSDENNGTREERHRPDGDRHGPVPVSCEVPEIDTTLMDAHNICIENVGKESGVDMAAARACITNCAKPVNNDTITDEQKTCMKEKVADIIAECSNIIDVELQEPKEKSNRLEKKGGLGVISYVKPNNAEWSTAPRKLSAILSPTVPKVVM